MWTDYNETENNLSSRSKLEQKLFAGIHGDPELKKEEKNRHLGEFKERIIKALTFDQVHEEGVYKEIDDAIKHPEARQLIISRQVDLDYAGDYIQLARLEGLGFTTVDDPDFKGPIGLIVAADEAMDVEEIYVQYRRDRLIEQGVPENLLDAQYGSYLCRDCMELLKAKAPEETDKFKTISIFDKLLGRKCVLCKASDD